jgi:hypothetical protein
MKMRKKGGKNTTTTPYSGYVFKNTHGVPFVDKK